VQNGTPKAADGRPEDADSGAQHEHDVFLDNFCKNTLPALLCSTNGRKRNILPVKRVKTIMKQDAKMLQPNIHVAAEGAASMSFSMQAFIRCLIAVAWRFTVARKRQTVLLQDLKSAVFAVQRFRFLVDLVHAYDNERDPSGPALPVIAPAPPMDLPMSLPFAPHAGDTSGTYGGFDSTYGGAARCASSPNAYAKAQYVAAVAEALPKSEEATRDQ
jgi:hypothetical protein